jgi:hypothetical protein
VPETVVLERALRVTVAGWPTFILTASASGNPATTCRFPRVARVRKVEEELPEVEEELPEVDEEPDAAPPEADPAEAEAEPEEEVAAPVELAPPPEMVSPTVPFKAMTVPENGAVSLVSDRACWSLLTFCWAVATAASSWVMLAGFT